MFGIRNSRLAGMAAMLVAVAFFAFMDAGLKQLATHYSAAQVAALRGLSSLPIVTAWSLWAGGVRPLIHVRWSLHLFRGLLAVIMLISFSYGVKTLSLSEAYAIFFVAPLIVTLFTMMFLGERVVGVQWLAIVLGFAGVLIVLKPEGTGFVSLGGLAILCCAVCYSLASVLVRVLGRTDTTYSMMFWMTTMLAVGSTLIALPGWQPIRAEDWGVLAVIAVAGSVAQYCVTVAFQKAPPASVAPLEYSAIAWGALIDYLVWAAVPGLRVYVGAAIVIASGLLLLRHESRTASLAH
jgi:drug/metabolite transporter (DMT)-like permease